MKSSKVKKFFLTFLILFGIFLLFGGWRILYDLWQAREVIRFVYITKKYAQKWEKMKMADTYGGKTPEETLQMYIEAVERGDYELASKYMVIEKQEEELQSLKTAPKQNIERFLQILKSLKKDDKLAWFERMYEDDVKKFGLNQPKEEYIRNLMELYKNDETMRTEVEGYDFTVDFVRYPNGIWKIKEF